MTTQPKPEQSLYTHYDVFLATGDHSPELATAYKAINDLLDTHITALQKGLEEALGELGSGSVDEVGSRRDHKVTGCDLGSPSKPALLTDFIPVDGDDPIGQSGPNSTQIMGMSHTSVDAYAGYHIGNGKYPITPNPLLGPNANPITPTEWEQLVAACGALNYDWGKIARAWFQLGRYLHNLSKRTHQTWLIDKVYYTDGGYMTLTGWLRAHIIAPPYINDPLALTDDSGALLPNDSSLTYLQPSEPEHKVIWWRHNKGNGHWEVG